MPGMQKNERSRSATNRGFSSRSLPSATRITAAVVVLADHRHRDPTERLERADVAVDE